MPTEIIQWFPGHMAKTRRMISEHLKQVDVVIEILDARIPYSSHNPEIMKIIEQKPMITLLNKASLADPGKTALFVKKYTAGNRVCLATDCITGEGMNKIAPIIKSIMSEKLKRFEEKGMSGR
ncbi:MAG: ribosome biogenesis GTPase YlqF, partial [Clostridia bacterium]|nr:ribosome biogenesis GTPase YlqF [Clostridia bacterium]